MAVAVRAVGVPANSPTAITPGLPTGTVADDIMVMLIETSDATITVADWTEKATTLASDGTTPTYIHIFWKRCVDPATDNRTTSDSGDHQVGQIISFSGCQLTGDPFNTSVTSVDNTASTSASITGGTTTIDNCFGIAAITTGYDAGANVANAEYTIWANASTSSVLEKMDRQTTAGNGGTIGLATLGYLYTAGTYDATTVTLTNSAPKAMWSGMLIPETAPATPTLNSPADNSSDTDTTPILDFTGTDVNSSDLRYNVQIYDKERNVPYICDSYSQTNQDAVITPMYFTGGNYRNVGQSFTGNGGTLSTIKFYLRKVGSPTGNLLFFIYAHSGTFGSTGVPTGASLGGSVVYDVTTLTTSFTTISAAPSAICTLVNGTNYFVTCSMIGVTGDASNYVEMGTDSSSPGHGGNVATWNGTSWAYDASQDACFYVYTTPIAITDVVSGTDAGFANPDNGADTDPFNSGENIQYTVQDALAVGDYWWRARAIDPTGYNSYGNWATDYKFTITAASNSNFFLLFD